MTDEKNKETQNEQMQNTEEEKVNVPEVSQSNAKVKSQKSESDFLNGFTRTDASVKINERGSFSVDGALPQVKRTPITDKTANGLSRKTY